MTQVELELEDTTLVPEAESTGEELDLDKHADKANDGTTKDAPEAEDEEGEDEEGEHDEDDEEKRIIGLELLDTLAIDFGADICQNYLIYEIVSL